MKNKPLIYNSDIKALSKKSSITVFDFPKKGFNVVESQLKHRDLIKCGSLKTIFKNIRSHISGHSVGTTRDETIAKEIIKIVLCKTYDEKFKAKEGYLDFYHEDGLEAETKKRINTIYTKVIEKYDEVFDKGDVLELDAKSVAYCVSQLQKYTLVNSDRNIISDAFETVIGYSLKGSSGQFFTPKNIVKLIISIVKPGKKEKVIDPACGSGGFLIESMLYNWDILMSNKQFSELAIIEEQRDYALKNLFGIEKDDFLAKICKSYMAVLGDGKAGICIDNSLKEPKNWDNNLIQLGVFDLVLTNPPFGKNIKVEDEISKNYMTSKIDIAFLERSVQLLKEGGKLAIVLSEVVFHAPTYKKFRDELMYRHNITHIIDLPHDTFRPYNNAKCIVIILEKETVQQDKIELINILEIGHDHNGKNKYEYDYTLGKYTLNKLDDVSDIINSRNTTQPNPNIKRVSSQLIKENDILIPRFYFDANDSKIEKSITIKQLIEENIITSFSGHGSPESHLKGKGTIPYIRVKDIVNYEVVINNIDLIPKINADKFKKTHKGLQERDIAMVNRGSYRIGEVGFIYPKDIDSIYTKEIQFFRVLKRDNKYNITSENLIYLLNNSVVKEQIKRMTFFDTTLPTLYKRWNLIKIPVLKKEDMEKITDKMKKCYTSRSEFWKEMDL